MSLYGPTFRVTIVDLCIIFQCNLYISCIMSCGNKIVSKLFQLFQLYYIFRTLRCIINNYSTYYTKHRSTNATTDISSWYSQHAQSLPCFTLYLFHWRSLSLEHKMTMTSATLELKQKRLLWDTLTNNKHNTSFVIAFNFAHEIWIYHNSPQPVVPYKRQM